MVEQYDTNSAVSHAVYTPYGTTSPGHALSFQNGFTWWAIHPDYVTLEAAGAPPVSTPAPDNDCAPALQKLLRYWVAVGRMTAKLGERDYILNSLSSTALLGLTVPSNSGFSLIGRGQSVSRLIVPYPTNTSGALAVVLPDSTCQFLLRDVSVIATTTNPNVAVSCGTAISMTVNFGSGANPPSQQYCGIVERLHIGPAIDPATGNGAAYFSTGLNLTAVSRPLVSATTVCGCDGPIAGDYSDTSPRYAMQTGIVVDECYSPQIEKTRVWHATTGVSLNTPTTGAQGFVCTGSNIEGVRTGINILYTGGLGPCPNGFVANNSIQFRDVGIYAGRVDVWSFANNTFWLEGDIVRTAPAYDMSFQVATHVTITGSRFAALCSDRTDCGARVNIHLDAETQINGNNYCASFLIDTNMFGAIDSYFAISAIQATKSARDIQIGASNKFSGTYTSSVVDDASGTAVTLAGFPGITNPPAVLPSGTPSTGQPTLGNANANEAWPQTFSVGYTLPQASALSAPSSGWKFFVDSGDHNKLKAIASTGAIVTLGTP